MSRSSESESPESLFVVFGAGPVGATTARQLAASGRRVRLVTRSGSGPEHPLIERHRGDLADAASARAATAGATAVVTAVNAPYRASAWAEAFPRFQANAIAAAGAADAVLVTAENLYMYGPSATPLRPDTPMRPSSAKGRVRAELAESLFAAHRRGDVRATTVRSADFFGPEALQSSAGERFVAPLLAGKGVRLLGDPDMEHGFSYVPDVARTIIAAATRPIALGRAWHSPVESLTPRRLAELVWSAAGHAGTPKVSAYSPLALTLLSVAPMIRELREMAYQFDRPFLVDTTDTATELGVTATPIDEAVSATVASFAARRSS